MMSGGRFRAFRGSRTTGNKPFDSDVFDGVGEALRSENAIDDEGDERLRSLIDTLNGVDFKPGGKGNDDGTKA